MAEVVTNFLSWFFPNIDTVPEPILVLLGTMFVGLFFSLIFNICGGKR